MISAFISYSHRDEEFRSELEVHLAMLKREGLVTLWHDRRITAGCDIDSAISTHLEDAQLVLLLVSPYFLDSDYCYDREMARAVEKHDAGTARVVPIIINPCEWQKALFGRLRATPPDGRPITKFPNIHDAYLAVVTDIRTAISELGEPAPSRALPVPSTPAAAPHALEPPRSSNLRVKKHFTEHDEDLFLDASFEYVANFFESSLVELQRRNSDLNVRYRRVDANLFNAAVYRHGQREATCRVWMGGGHARGILFSFDDEAASSGYNECLGVATNGQMLLLEPQLGLALAGINRGHLSQEGAAEYLWAAFISPLQ
jgi:hypothetical protein